MHKWKLLHKEKLNVCCTFADVKIQEDLPLPTFSTVVCQMSVQKLYCGFFEVTFSIIWLKLCKLGFKQKTLNPMFSCPLVIWIYSAAHPRHKNHFMSE